MPEYTLRITYLSSNNLWEAHLETSESLPDLIQNIQDAAEMLRCGTRNLEGGTPQGCLLHPGREGAKDMKTCGKSWGRRAVGSRHSCFFVKGHASKCECACGKRKAFA